MSFCAPDKYIFMAAVGAIYGGGRSNPNGFLAAVGAVFHSKSIMEKLLPSSVQIVLIIMEKHIFSISFFSYI